MKELLTKDFDEKDIDTAISILRTYNGPESKRVRKAVIKLALGSIDGLKYYTECANKDYRDVLYWAEYPDEAEQALKNILGGMTVNERLFHLDLFDQYDSAVIQKDENKLREILLKCQLSNDSIEEIIKTKI